MIHMLDLAPHLLFFRCGRLGPYILIHSDILLQDWKVLQDVIIDCMEDSLYWMTSDVLESPCTISLFYIAGGVSFLLVLQLFYLVIRVVHHDLRVLVL